jgi:hypothetical protein
MCMCVCVYVCVCVHWLHYQKSVGVNGGCRMHCYSSNGFVAQKVGWAMTHVEGITC